MSTMYWTGNASAVAQVTKLVPANVEIGDTFSAIIGSKRITVTATAATVANVVGLLIEAWNASEFPEFAEITASEGTTTTAGVTSVTHVVLTANTPGKPFTVTTAVTNAGAFTVTVNEIVAGAAGVNEKQVISLAGTSTGGTFTLTYAGQTTAAIAYNAAAATIDTELEALSNIGAGDVSVSGAAGGPWTVEFTGALAATNVQLIEGDGSSLTGAPTITVTTVTEGSAVSTEVQRFEFYPSAVAGHLQRVLLDVSVLYGQAAGTTVREFNVQVNDSAATVQAAIDAALVVDGRTVVVSETGGVYEITFWNDPGINFPEMTSEAIFPIGSTETLVHSTVVNGNPGGTNEVQQVRLNYGPTGGTFTLTFEGQTTGAIAYNATKYTVRAALVALSNVAGVSEVQTLTSTGAATGGTFTLTYGGQTTTPIAYNASAATIQAALEALSSIGGGNVVCAGGAIDAAPVTVTFSNDLAFTNVALMTATNTGLTGGTSPAITPSTTTAGVNGDVTVSGNAGGPWTITFVNTLGSSDRDAMTAASSLTGATVMVVTNQLAVAAVNEQQLVTLDGGPSGGTFTLTFNAETTGNIAYNATAATVLAALEGLATPVPGDFTVVGAAGGPYLVTFTGAYAATDVAAMTGDGTLLTGGGSQTLTATAVTANTGPWNWDNANNWSGLTLPVTGDIVHFEHNNIPCRYGLAQTAVTLAELHVDQSYEGEIGLPRINNDGDAYEEYRARFLAIGATLVFVGQGEGNGAAILNLDNSNIQVTGICEDTGQSADSNTPAFCWKGTHASNAWIVKSGDFGAAVFPGETATMTTLRTGPQEFSPANCQVFLGAGCTLATVLNQGAELTINSNVTTLTTSGGTTWQYAGTITTCKVTGTGTLLDHSSGTITTIEVTSGATYQREEPRAKTITTAVLYAGATFVDEHGTLTITNPIQLFETTLSEIDLRLGRNIALALTYL